MSILYYIILYYIISLYIERETSLLDIRYSLETNSAWETDTLYYIIYILGIYYPPLK